MPDSGLSGPIDALTSGYLFGPDFYGQQLEIQRRQALANALLQGGTTGGMPTEIAGHPTGPLPFLVGAVGRRLGSYEAKKANQQEAALYGGLLRGPQSFVPPSDVSQNPAASTMGGGIDRTSQTLQQQPPQPPLWVQAKIIEAQYGPEAGKAFLASGGDLNRALQIVNAGLMKGTALEPPTAPTGYVQIPDPNSPGGYRLTQETGGPTAVTGSAAAKTHGEEKPIQVTMADGTPRYVYPSDLAGAPPGLPPVDQNGVPRPTGNMGVDYNNPLNMSPGGQEARYTNNTAGVLAASANLDRYAQQGINTINGIVRKWAPQAPPEYAVGVARSLGVSADQPLNLADPNVKGALMEAMSPHETGRPLPTAGRPPQLQTPVGAALQKSAGEQASDFASLKANTENLLQILKDARALNQKLPDSGLIPMEARAEGSRRMASMPFGIGDKGQLAANYDSWESLMNIKAINAIEQIAKSGIGRMDIPIVNAVKAAILASADNTKQGRGQVLDQLESMVRNNLATAQNTLSNLNQRGAQMPHAPLVSSFPNQQSVPQQPKFIEGQIYKDKNGNTARYRGGQFVAP